MKVLFIGGTGIISSACSELAISKGIDLYHLNRGKSSHLRKISGVKTLVGDIRNIEESKTLLQGHYFDCVVDWIAFEPEHIKNDIDLFNGITKQFVFISSASCYQTPPKKVPVTEDTILENPYWEYSRKKIACERLLEQAYKNDRFPYTIVRPSHTYDKTLIPMEGGYTAFQRMKDGIPVVVHGDGTSLWTLTHHKDFAVGLVGLLGRKEAINEAYHITSDEGISWNSIFTIIAEELGVSPKLIHIPSNIIAKYDKEIGASLLGDKAHSMLFDNSKIKNLVPEFECKIQFEEGAKEIVKWHLENEDTLKADQSLNRLFDQMISDFPKV